MNHVIELLKIQSPTGNEKEIFLYIKKRLSELCPDLEFLIFNHSLIAHWPLDPQKKHISLIGHTDVVPAHFEPYIKEDHLFGSGASDMKGSLGVYLNLLEKHGTTLRKKYNVSFVLYEKEEQTPMIENGLYHLIQKFSAYFKSIDCAIVGEPTDLDLHLGCLGSLHARFKILGKACHSARPWNGENAIYKALPIIEKMAQWPTPSFEVAGVTFREVIQLTELMAEKGRTTLPGWVEGNVNYRFAPVYSTDEAKIILANHFQAVGLKKEEYEFLDISPAGQVIESDFFNEVIQTLALPLRAKQAWTDVAQLSALGIPALNFGAGATQEAHQTNEKIPLKNLERYEEILENLLIKD